MARKGSWLKVGGIMALVAVVAAFNASAITGLINKYIPAIGQILRKS